jgi:CRISPR-associated protein Csy1
LNASVAPATLERARTAFARGDDAATLRELEGLLAPPSAPLEALALAVNAALRCGALERAIEWLARLHAMQPQNPQFARMLSNAHNNLGAQRRNAGDLHGASAGFAAALAAWPGNADALVNRAQLALAARQPLRALEDLRQATALRPDDLAASLLRTETEIALGAPDPLARLRAAVGDEGLRVIDPLRVALALSDGADIEGALQRLRATDQPHRALAAADVAWRLAQNGEAGAARTAHRHVTRLCANQAPGLYATLAAELTLPQVYADTAHIDVARGEFERGLATLEQSFDPVGIARHQPLLEQLAWSNQMLAYQGRDDVALVARYARWLTAAARTLAPQFAAAPREGAGRRRIGFISAAFRESTIGAYFARWIEAATSAGFETVVVQLPPSHDAFTARLERSATRMLRPQGALVDIARQIRDLQLDLALYPDLGVDGRVGVLAALAMAPRQAMAWGHPSTFGLDSIDAFIGCEAMEPDEPQGHYSERLCGLPMIGTGWHRPPAPQVLPREALGLPPGRCYLLPQSPYKVHPDTDATLVEIARADPGGRIVLMQGERPGATRQLHARLSRAFEQAGANPRQLHFLPMTDRPRFLATCAAADVMVDTLHWSGGNTTLDALHAGLPVVTVPGALMRGRQSAAILHLLGLDHCIAGDPLRQAGRAVEIAHDPALRARLAGQAATNFAPLCEGREALAALVAHFESLIDTVPRHG